MGLRFCISGPVDAHVAYPETQLEYQDQQLANQPVGQIQPFTSFVNKVLLEHTHAHLLLYCLWLLSYCNGLRSSKSKILAIALLEKVAAPALDDSFDTEYLVLSTDF